MPGPLLHSNAMVTCAHTGQTKPLAPNPRVKVSGQPIVTKLAPSCCRRVRFADRVWGTVR